MELTKAITWAAERNLGVLITVRADGRPQSSDIVFAIEDSTFLISITDSRAKTRNLRRDPRAVLHFSDPSGYVSFDGTVELSPIAQTADDPTVEALLRHYEAVRGSPHPNVAEFRQGQVDERRLIATFTPASVVGWIH